MSRQQIQHEDAIRQYLTTNEWPLSIQNILIDNISSYPIRFFVVDNSGSMSISDGHHYIRTRENDLKLVSCSRWKELTQAMEFHARLSNTAGVKSVFRLLNDSPPIIVGEDDGSNYLKLLNLFERSPGGKTPLCYHIREIVAEIRDLEPTLRASGQKAVIVIATDGESTDGELAQAMKPLENLPVWVVIRLCTDDNSVVNYWNNIEKQVELNLDILDDLIGEAKEIRSTNPWLVYCEPLHRLREFGISLKELDLIDEAPLNLAQAQNVINSLVPPQRVYQRYSDDELELLCNDVENRIVDSPKIRDPLNNGKHSAIINVSELRKIRKHRQMFQNQNQNAGALSGDLLKKLYTDLIVPNMKYILIIIAVMIFISYIKNSSNYARGGGGGGRYQSRTYRPR